MSARIGREALSVLLMSVALASVVIALLHDAFAVFLVCGAAAEVRLSSRVRPKQRATSEVPSAGDPS